MKPAKRRQGVWWWLAIAFTVSAATMALLALRSVGPGNLRTNTNHAIMPAFIHMTAGAFHSAAAIPAPLLYQGVRRKTLLQLPRPASVTAGVVRTLHWAGAATGSDWDGALPIEGIESLYRIACGGATTPSRGELVAAVSLLKDAGRVILRNSSQLFIGPHFAHWTVVSLVWSPTPLAELVLRAAGNRPPSVLNLGAGHYSAGDANADPTYALLQEHPGGLSVLVEANAGSLAHTVDRLKDGGAHGIVAVPALITPDTIVAVLSRAAAAPTHWQPDLLKIDIDGFDCAVVEALLDAGYRPSLIAAEVNPDFPPPLLFEVGFDPEFRIATGTAGFFGCSTARWAAVGAARGYVVLQGDTRYSSHDVVLVRSSLVPLFEAKYNMALDALTAFREMDLAGNVGAHWTSPSPLSMMRASEHWGGALAQLPLWAEQMQVRALIHNDGASAGVYTLSVDVAPPDALVLVEGWGAQARTRT